MSKYMFSEDFLLSVVEHYKDHSVGETAQNFNISKKVVERIIKNSNVEKHKPYSRVIITEKDKKFILDNYQFLSDTAMAKKLHIHTTHLYEIYKELGLKIRSHQENVVLGQKLQQQTCLEKYGTPFAAQNKEIANKARENRINRSPEEKQKTKEKTEQTCLRKYGVKHTLQVNSFREKGRQTCLEKYGVDSYLKTPECREKNEKYKEVHGNEIQEKKQKNMLRKIRL